MPDPASRAKAYGEKAEECLRLADMATEISIATEYRRLAKSYRELAEFELAQLE
jgi:hypothetical protein